MRGRIQQFLDCTSEASQSPQSKRALIDLAGFLRSSSSENSKTYFLGNGASASIASTLAFKLLAEQNLSAVAVNDHNLLLGLSRKSEFADWMAAALGRLFQPEDRLVLVSSSGESENVVRAARQASDANVPVFSLTGFADGNRLRGLSQGNIWVDSFNYNVVESAHLFLGLLAVKSVHQSAEDAESDIESAVVELAAVNWDPYVSLLDDFAQRLKTMDFAKNRIIFLGDGSSASIASHLTTDFCKSELFSQTINDHNFLSAAQNDFGPVDWQRKGLERIWRPGDLVVMVSHCELFPAELEVLQWCQDRGVETYHHGVQSYQDHFSNLREVIYPEGHLVNNLVVPSLGLLGIAEAFLEELQL